MRVAQDPKDFLATFLPPSAAKRAYIAAQAAWRDNNFIPAHLGHLPVNQSARAAFRRVYPSWFIGHYPDSALSMRCSAQDWEAVWDRLIRVEWVKASDLDFMKLEWQAMLADPNLPSSQKLLGHLLRAMKMRTWNKKANDPWVNAFYDSFTEHAELQKAFTAISPGCPAAKQSSWDKAARITQGPPAHLRPRYPLLYMYKAIEEYDEQHAGVSELKARLLTVGVGTFPALPKASRTIDELWSLSCEDPPDIDRDNVYGFHASYFEALDEALVPRRDRSRAREPADNTWPNARCKHDLPDWGDVAAVPPASVRRRPAGQAAAVPAGPTITDYFAHPPPPPPLATSPTLDAAAADAAAAAARLSAAEREVRDAKAAAARAAERRKQAEEEAREEERRRREDVVSHSGSSDSSSEDDDDEAPPVEEDDEDDVDYDVRLLAPASAAPAPVTRLAQARRQGGEREGTRKFGQSRRSSGNPQHVLAGGEFISYVGPGLYMNQIVIVFVLTQSLRQFGCRLDRRFVGPRTVGPPLLRVPR